MGFFGSFGKKSTERVLLVSIGSSTVAAALVDIGEKVSTVIVTVSTDISVLSDLSLSQFEREMEKSLRQTLLSLGKAHATPPDRVSVFFSSPWYASQVRTAKMNRPQPFVISKALVADMITRELKAFEAEEIGSAGTEPLRAIESKVIQVKLNGYPTNEPTGVSATEVEISLFLSVAQEKTLVRVEELIHAQYHKPVTFSSFLSASFIVARDFFPHQSDYLLVDVGGEVTDVTLVREFSLVQSISIPIGRNYIFRKLAVGLGRSVEESVSLCTLYLEDKVETSMKEACAKILSDAKDVWLAAFQKALFSVSNELSIPDTILLSVGPDVESWFIETIGREKFNQYSLTEKEFKIIVLNAEVFHEFLAFQEGVSRNSCIILEALACTRLAENSQDLSLPKKK